jgi:hypothetical protein
MARYQPLSQPDPRALKILFDTYWSSKGWKEKPTTSREDLAYATAAGMMFPPRDFRHDATVQEVITLRDQIKPRDVADAFLASLTSQRLDLRSALASYAIARHLPEHKFVRSENRDQRDCAVCGEPRDPQLEQDVNVLNFERFKWGGVRHLNLYYVAFDLGRFAETQPLKPTVEDRAVLKAILDVARNADAKLISAKLQKEIAPLVAGNKDVRGKLLEILGIAGVLVPKDYPNFFDSFVGFEEINESYGDEEYPVCWWRGSDGVNDKAVKFWWPRL